MTVHWLDLMLDLITKFIAIFLAFQLLRIIADIIAHLRCWRGFRLLGKFSSADLQSARRLIYIAKVTQHFPKGGKK